ncbi:thioredoxin domain-containing protein [Halobellus sp. Atlit-31R]|nr:thioredoxin domain-containing protein [Halobellus sp. Atlit-31R]
MTDDRTHVEWREWGPAPFEEARAADRPVLLALTATWCDSCHEMDAETYAEPRIAANVNDGFVPVRVDVDRRPRVRERYNMGGFPSTVFCTPSGRVITGATYLGPDGLRQVLDSVREVWADRGADAGRIPRALAGDATPVGPVDDRIEAHLAGQLDEKWDPEFAGWGDGAKFPLPRTIEFALKRTRTQATETLGVLAESLYDHDDGGFYRYAEGRDWSDPHREKVLDANAALLRAFANGYLYTGDESLLESAYGTRDFLLDRLWNGSAFGGSVAPSGDSDGADGEFGPRRDLNAYAGGNALTADAFLTLVGYTDDETAREYARRVLDTLAADFVDDEGVVSHVDPGAGSSAAGGDAPATPELLLEDQARVVAAFTRARQVLGPDALATGREPLEIARAAADRTIETLQEPDGAFRDGPDTGVGLLDEPLRPLDGGVEMADALLDLAALLARIGGESDGPPEESAAATGDRYADAAHDAVAAFAGAWDRIGVQVAGYGAVTARLTRPGLVVAVGDAAGSDLHRAALRVADHEAVVVPDAPEVPRGTARVHRGTESRESTAPAELMQAVSALTDGT